MAVPLGFYWLYGEPWVKSLGDEVGDRGLAQVCCSWATNSHDYARAVGRRLLINDGIYMVYSSS